VTQTLDTAGGPVSLILDGPDDSTTALVLAPGAGAGMRHEFMQFFAERLAQDRRVVRFDFLYMERGRRAPDKQPVLEETYRAVVRYVRDELKPRRLVIGGKSMGGRIASHVAASGEAVDGLVFLGYPLHPPGKPERIRDAHLYEVSAPMLFVEGTRDPFCPLSTLERVRAKLAADNDVFIVDDGDHSLKVRKSSGRSTTEAWVEAVSAIDDWIEALGSD
jgi:uncharacterized protein